MKETQNDNELTTEDVHNGNAVQQQNDGPEGMKNRLSQYGMWVLAVAAGLAVMVAVSLITVRLSTPEIVTFDMKGTMDAFLQQSAQLPMDEQQVKQRVSRFNAVLTDSLYDWQVRHRAIILVAPAVVSHQRDITLEIQNSVARTMSQTTPLAAGEGK